MQDAQGAQDAQRRGGCNSCKGAVAKGLPNNNLEMALGCVEGCRMRRERRMPNVGAVAIVANERLQRVY